MSVGIDVRCGKNVLWLNSVNALTIVSIVATSNQVECMCTIGAFYVYTRAVHTFVYLFQCRNNVAMSCTDVAVLLQCCALLLQYCSLLLQYRAPLLQCGALHVVGQCKVLII